MWRVAAIAWLALAAAPAPQIVEPRLSLWYRGMPEGVARATDLDAARAMGFSAVTWPFASGANTDDLIRLAGAKGLKVILRAPASVSPEIADLDAARLQPDAILPMAWRALAHGARIISIDPGAAGGSIEQLAARQPRWAPAIIAIGQQFGANGPLFAQCRPGPSVVVDRPPAGTDVMLLDAGRSWVVAATNASERAARVVAHLPPAVPYAMWVNLLDGSTMAMLDEPAGPRWAFDLDPWGVKIYVIDKTLK
jgi:hypothetical protein